MAAGCPARAVEPTGTGRSQALDEFDLTHGAHLFWSAHAVHGAGLNKHGGAHIVTALDVRHQLVEEIALVGETIRAKVPEMVMGIADG